MALIFGNCYQGGFGFSSGIIATVGNVQKNKYFLSNKSI